MANRFGLAVVAACVATTLVSFPVHAADSSSDSTQSRRRPVRWGGPTPPPPPPPPPSSGCFTFNAVRPGLVATYRTVSSDGTVSFTVTYLSDSDTQTKTTQKVQSPGPFGPVETDVETTIDYDLVAVTGGQARAVRKLYVKATTPVAGFTSTTETTSDFVPSLLTGPKNWCAGDEFRVPPSTQSVTAVSTPGGTTTSVVVTNEGVIKVISVNESVTVPAGAFETVRHDGVSVAGSVVSPSTVWTSKQHSVLVKQIVFDESGQVENTTELLSVQ